MTHFHGSLIGLRRVAPPANRRRPFVFVAFVSFVLHFGCSGSTPSQSAPLVSVTKEVGSWSGRGTTTVGDVNSETGRLRITWKTTNEAPAGSGRFKLTLRSGVSGRTIAVVADHQGMGAGTVDTDEGPRTYDFLVESANVDWSFRVEETSGAVGPRPPAN
ncbi:MAG: hypothetical protein K2Y23_21740 [Cyanobacteria bacterium]|nr:hypothetical protein [Cyanobacteriota bacterium]